MPAFGSKKFRPSSYQNSLGALYRRKLNNHPFLLFGLPFIFTIVAGMYIFRAYSSYNAGRLSRLQHTFREQKALTSPSDCLIRRSYWEDQC